MARKRGFNSSGDEFSPESYGREEMLYSAGRRDTAQFKVGQRWVSEMEPELGLGKITSTQSRFVEISFHGGADKRRYSKENAPLLRVQFGPNSHIELKNGKKLLVLKTEEKDQELFYTTKEGVVAESELSDSMRAAGPLDRLMAGEFDPLSAFTLRYDAQKLKSVIENSNALGFTGPRIQLIPHQLYIAQQVAARYKRRVLLADEVGLGKTIEACLILHRLILTAKVNRVLITVPNALVHLWFVELLRKFNLTFKIFDEQYLNGIEDKECNPFLTEQFVLCTTDLLVKNTIAAQQALNAKWDLLVVDEVHHAREGSDFFRLLEKLTLTVSDVLFLSATPEHYGNREHFARLQLLDSARYGEYDTFLKEMKFHSQIAAVTGKILDGNELTEEEVEFLTTLSASHKTISAEEIRTASSAKETTRDEMVATLLDLFGVGRAIFRNTRANIGGFPSRTVMVKPLQANKSVKERVIREYKFDSEPVPSDTKISLSADPRIDYIVSILKEFKDQKMVLICTTKEKAVAIDAALKKKISVDTALFHEDMTLIQRDRNAAWFSEEDGARLLLCSEIGSEGRNFQFAHHLILFDLPHNPSLLEQRIGRLDRIGQKGPIIIHLPVIIDTPYSVLARWYNEGLELLETSFAGSFEVYERVREELREVIAAVIKGSEKEELLEKLIAHTFRVKTEIAERLQSSRDRLLEQHSFRPLKAKKLIDLIRKTEKSKELERVVMSLLKEQGIFAEQTGNRTYKLWADAFGEKELPGIRESRPVITFDRSTALHREDFEFITMDHPSVRGLFDLYLGSASGNCTLVQVKGKKQKLILETVFVIECNAPLSLNTSRFLPPEPVRIAVDQSMNDCTDEINALLSEDKLVQLKTHPILSNEHLKMLFPEMVRSAEEVAFDISSNRIKRARQEISKSLGNEIDRFNYLRDLNESVSEQELEAVRKEKDELIEAVDGAVLRLDALRLIILHQG
ncbi:RNA polymerase-associated protein RapA [Chitinispirillales bacterium ANBcel5]|uniref:RNA polymerase-associated protein RapA n=1 Tax=Cellulosispirillum alkaliphilum TaxID=3039283 RepID=UPI002A510EEF|nr:RNA polymerase-associated protein RapA [Chitinispirillales bacterium ANBcel5]